MNQLTEAPGRWFWVRRILLAIGSTAVAFLATLRIGVSFDSILPIRDPYSRFYLILLTYWLLALSLSAIVSFACRSRREFLWASLRATALLTLLPILPVLFHVPPLERGVQKRTMAAMRTIAQSMASYRQASGAYPRVSNVGELSRLLGRQLPFRDEWHTPLVLSAEPSRYVLTSHGSDGQPDCVPVEGPTTEFACDIVLVNGAFVSWPRGRSELGG